MKRILKLTLVAAALTLLIAGPASAGGVNPAQLQRAGWECFDVPGLGVHCSPPGSALDGSRIAMPLLYFIGTTNPGDTDAKLTGTEMLLAPGAYHGQPCPQEGLDEWHDLGFARACHHK
jgi:hypothetical protein